MVDRRNKACRYFPCHEGLEDCTFCYCPFYPCGEESRGEYVLTAKGEKIWSCMNCVSMHKKSVVDRIYRIIAENKEVKEICFGDINESD